MTRRPPATRLAAVANIPTWASFRFSPAELTELRVTDLTGLIAAYAHAEQSAREIHDQLEQLAARAPERVCIVCGKPITGRVDKVVCSGRCRMRAYRHRGPLPILPRLPPAPATPATQRSG